MIEKSRFLASLRVNIIWKLLRNDSGVSSILLEIDLASFFNVKLDILNIYLHSNSPNENIAKFNFKSQHLIINLDQGTPLKGAPGHKSMGDSNIINSY